jgi:site-specific recombinase XerD
LELKKAIDEFMFYLEVEKNCSPNTLRGYAFDLSVLESFIRKMYDSKSLDDFIDFVCIKMVLF